MYDIIADKAEVLFSEKGFDGIGLRQIAEAAEINVGSLYYHIDSKQGLFFDLVERAMCDLLFDTEKAVSKSKDPVQAFVSTFFNFKVEKPHRLKLILNCAGNLSPVQMQLIMDLKKTYAQCLHCAVSKSSRCDVESRGLHPVALSILSMLYGCDQWSGVTGAAELPILIEASKALVTSYRQPFNGVSS